MAIFTPRGLKVRLPVDYSFGLIARLHPRLSAFRFLKTVEAFEALPSMCALIVGIATLSAGWRPTGVAIATGSAQLVMHIFRMIPLPIGSPLVEASRIFSFVNGFGFFVVVACVIGYLKLGPHGVLAFLLGRITAGLLGALFSYVRLRLLFLKTGEALIGSSSEMNFFNAYLYHARQLSLTEDFSLTHEEVEKNTWRAPLDELAEKWPGVVARFTIEAHGS